MASIPDNPPYLEHFPLRIEPANILESLCRVLFGWVECPQCGCQGNCGVSTCQWEKKALLSSYLQFYRSITAQSTPEDWSDPQPALSTHSELLDLVSLIMKNSTIRREVLIQQYFAKNGCAQPSYVDRGRAFDLALNAITMIPCSERNYYMDSEPFPVWVTWRNCQSACDLVQNAIPKGPSLTVRTRAEIFQRVSAQTLEDSGIKLVTTRNMSKHLFLDPSSKCVYIFPHLGFLKARLAASNNGRRLFRSVPSPSVALYVSHESLAISSRATSRRKQLSRYFSYCSERPIPQVARLQLG